MAYVGQRIKIGILFYHGHLKNCPSAGEYEGTGNSCYCEMFMEENEIELTSYGRLVGGRDYAVEHGD